MVVIPINVSLWCKSSMGETTVLVFTLYCEFDVGMLFVDMVKQLLIDLLGDHPRIIHLPPQVLRGVG